MTALDAATERLLLGRPVRSTLNEGDQRAFADERVLITGAGGSVGAELARQLAACRPEELVLLDHAEYALFQITRELREQHPSLRIASRLADVSRLRDMTTVCLAHRPQYVFHAAACKHVTIAEECIVSAARTNVLGAFFAARAARRINARFVLISTDKAAEPRSVMGATKRMAELAVLRAPRKPGSIAVRFGNVLGSSGSVVEILMESARLGRPLTVTDPDATRFFMTAAEAVSLVLKAALSGRAGEVFWLDMGKPLRLGDLVERVLEVATPAGASRAAIRIIGLRPGEKRHEELTTQGLEMQSTADPGILCARQAPERRSVERMIHRLRQACRVGNAADVLRVLQEAVSDYIVSDHAYASAGISPAEGTRMQRSRRARPIAVPLPRWRQPA